MRVFSRAAGAAALVLLASAAPAHAQGFGRPPLFVSPAGQVFRVEEHRQPMEAWFAQADADGDGAITQDEMVADFARAFATFDLNNDGEIDPEEVTRYETSVFPEMAVAVGFRGRGRTTAGAAGGQSRPRGTGAPTGTARRAMGGAAVYGLLPIYHPLMDADENMNRGISRSEFAAAARRRFGMLDVAQSGRLTLRDLARHRAGGPGQGRGPRPGQPPRPRD